MASLNEGRGLGRALARIALQKRRWLVTGAAGFIGSHLAERLLACGQTVVGMDNFSTGKRANLAEVGERLGAEVWSRFELIEGDIRDPDRCRAACQDVEIVLHQAAIGSVPRSIADPQSTHATNVSGFVNMLDAARSAGVRRFVYASSSSVYGSDTTLPKREDRIGEPLSPYAASKLADEIYAGVFARCYGVGVVGLRYFNVFGARQDPDGPYAAVIPRWIAAIAGGREVTIHGDGTTSRDFCHVDNVVQANLLAALAADPGAINTVYNVAVGQRSSLDALFRLLDGLLRDQAGGIGLRPTYGPFRAGDVRHSIADVRKAREWLGYTPDFGLEEGVRRSLPWYLSRLTPAGVAG